LQQYRAFADQLAFVAEQTLDHACPGAADAVLHLHRFQHDEGGSGLDLLPGLDQHADDAAVHGGGQAALVRVLSLRCSDWVECGDCVQLTVPLQVKRVAFANGIRSSRYLCRSELARENSSARICTIRFASRLAST